MAPALLDRLLGRDATPPPEALEDGSADTAEPEPTGAALRAVVAQKLLHAWVQNRHQVMVPLSLNLGRLEPRPRALLVQTMACALLAGGANAAADRTRLSAALARVGGEAEGAAAEAALARPPNLLELLVELEQAGLSAHGYAAAALVLNHRVVAERAFLDWLAARFALPPSLTTDLARRYRR